MGWTPIPNPIHQKFDHIQSLSRGISPGRGVVVIVSVVYLLLLPITQPPAQNSDGSAVLQTNPTAEQDHAIRIEVEVPLYHFNFL
jgi:hypothetical protein